MVVDDSVATRKYILFALRSQGCKVLIARDDKEAHEKLGKENIDLVITDLSLPNIDGIDLVKSIQNHPNYGDLPIIVIASLTRDEKIQLSEKLGKNVRLIRPFDRKQVQFEVAKFLIKKRHDSPPQATE